MTEHPPPPIGDNLVFSSLNSYYDPESLAQDGQGFLVSSHGVVTAFVHSGSEMRFLAFIEFAPGQTRGNHYHRSKTENLCIVRGSVQGYFAMIGYESSMWQTILSAGDIVTIKPGCVHAFKSADGAVAVEYSPQAFVESDTYPVEIQ